MPNKSRGSGDKGSKDAGRQSQRNSDSSYAPEWSTKSIDIVPPNDKPLPENPVAEAIMGVDSPKIQTPEPDLPRQNSPAQPSPDQGPAES